MHSPGTNPMNGESREALRKAITGDMAAFEELYTHYLTPIYRFVFVRLKSREEAKDITQNVFVKAWRALPRYRDEGKPFSAWLYAIARNTIIDHWKKKKEVRLEDNEELAANLRDARNDPTENAEQSREREQLHRAIRGLSEEQQELVVMKFLNDLSNKEISEITGRSEDAIRQLQFRTLKALRNVLNNK